MLGEYKGKRVTEKEYKNMEESGYAWEVRIFLLQIFKCNHHILGYLISSNILSTITSKLPQIFEGL